MQGDASSRAYERLTNPDGAKAVLMISPPKADGPPVRDGKPYSAIVHLAESVHAFVAMDRGLRALGLSAPKILGEDLEAGLLILEDLGSEPVVDQGGPRPERYAEAVKVLARLHGTTLPTVLPVAEGRDHEVPPYDREALLFEAELLPEWYAPFVANAPLAPDARASFVAAWSEALEPLESEARTWTLRDYHSPNLIWLPERDGIERIGVIDFQDAVLGHRPTTSPRSCRMPGSMPAPSSSCACSASTPASATDARRRVRHAGLRPRLRGAGGAAAATKILGIFARLDRRDGKPGYLAHLPRIEGYLARNLAHPALSGVRAWYAQHLRAPLPGRILTDRRSAAPMTDTPPPP